MRGKSPFHRFGYAALALVAVLFAGFSLGLHSQAEAVGQPAHEPATIYFSEHSPGSSEEHLHAETGFERAFCLACILSLRDEAVLGQPQAILAGRLLGGVAVPPSPVADPSGSRHAFSSRAPPRA